MSQKPEGIVDISFTDIFKFPEFSAFSNMESLYDDYRTSQLLSDTFKRVTSIGTDCGKQLRFFENSLPYEI